MPVICVTGASSGIGWSIVERFADNGWKVIAMARRFERLQKLCTKYPDLLHAVELDVRDRTAVETAFAALPTSFADIDVMVNNAGLALGITPAQESSLDNWDTMVDTNIKGLLYTTHAVLPGMVARNAGHVINMGSIAGKYAYPGGNVYSATKAFVLLFTRGLRCDLHGTGVRVTVIEPGLLETEFAQVRFNGDEARAKLFYAGAEPLRPEHVAETIFWAVHQPLCVNVTELEVMPTCQSLGATCVYRPDK